MKSNTTDAQGNEYTFRTPEDWGTLTGVLLPGPNGKPVFAEFDPKSGHLKFAVHPERSIQTGGNIMKNIFADIQARSQRMTERAQKIAEVKDEIISSMKEINLMLDETNLYVRQIERDNVEIKSDCDEIRTMIRELCINVHTLIDENPEQTIGTHIHGLAEVTL